MRYHCAKGASFILLSSLRSEKIGLFLSKSAGKVSDDPGVIDTSVPTAPHFALQMNE
jgi:hypothetical protein